jgi:hypothetical protein
MAIEQVKIRARVEIGTFSVSTPFVQSFNVRKQRGQISTFDATLKVSHDTIGGGLTGDSVKIYAGSDNPSKLIFTGICRAAKTSPCYDDPKYVMLSISGSDILSLLQGKKYTRRCRSSKASWMAITGVIREGLKSGRFAFEKNVIEIDKGTAFGEGKGVSKVPVLPSTDKVKPAIPEKPGKAKTVPIEVTLLNDAPGGA